MYEVGPDMKALQFDDWRILQCLRKAPGQRARRQEIHRLECLNLGRNQGGFEKAFRNHERCNQSQHEQGLTRVVFAVTLRYGIALRLEYATAHGRNDAGQQHPGGGVIFDEGINMAQHARKSRENKTFPETMKHKGNGTHAENQEPNKYKDVQHPCQHITRLTPLNQPDFGHLPQARPHPVEALVRRGRQHRHKTTVHEIGEHTEADKWDQKAEQDGRDVDKAVGGR